ncbi:MAG: hypothetical protein H0T54_01220 [Geodermatophilaceae bacterium]|nr:hypothetical protein [Geodermatophilaceae bacterium]
MSVVILIIVLIMVGGALLLLSMGAPSAQAAPVDRPVEVVIASVSPRVSGPGTVIEVSGTLVNTTDVAITDLTVRLQRGPVLQSRTDLADNDSDPVEVNASSTAFVDLTRPLLGSGVLPFTYTTTPEALRLSEPGSYPLLVNVNGQPGSDPASRVGEQVVLLPYLDSPPTAVTQLSWLWPLVSTPERNAAGVFTGTDLASSLAAGGRLDVALSAIETTPGADGSTLVPQAVTLAIDPELLEAVTVLADGDYQLLVDGQQQTSTFGSADAASWLSRLRTLALSHPIVSLPYADPDVATLIAQGQGQAVERLLPDGPAGALVQQVLGVRPQSTIAWPPDGATGNPAVLDMFAQHGVRQLVTSDLLTFQAPPELGTLDAVSTIDTRSGPLTALVADHVLSDLVGHDISEAGSEALTEQRFLAELVAIASEGTTSEGSTSEGTPQGRHLLIAPERDFDPTTAASMMLATAGQAWLGRELPTDLDLTVSRPAPRTLLSPSPVASMISGEQLSGLLVALRAREDFASALSEPDTALLGLDRALARAATINRRFESELQEAAVLDVAAAVDALRATVGIIEPANGTYSLASADAPLVLTVRNDNAFPVEVTVALAPRGAPGVQTTNVVQELPAQTVTTIPVPANIERSGSFTVIATLSTPAGSSLGAPVQLRVQSTVYGPVALVITFGAAGLLALLFARRSVKYYKRRRRALPGGGPAGPVQSSPSGDRPSAPEPSLVDPPRRSPV